MRSHCLWRPAPSLFLLMLTGDLTVCHGSNHGLADSPPASAFDHAVAKSWMDLAYTLVKTQPGHSPPVASRVYAYTGVTLYESIVHGAPEHRSLVGQLNGLAIGTYGD
jgi:hypothetical protein